MANNHYQYLVLFPKSGGNRIIPEFRVLDGPMPSSELCKWWATGSEEFQEGRTNPPTRFREFIDLEQPKFKGYYRLVRNVLHPIDTLNDFWTRGFNIQSPYGWVWVTREVFLELLCEAIR